MVLLAALAVLAAGCAAGSGVAPWDAGRTDAGPDAGPADSDQASPRWACETIAEDVNVEFARFAYRGDRGYAAFLSPSYSELLVAQDDGDTWSTEFVAATDGFGYLGFPGLAVADDLVHTFFDDTPFGMDEDRVTCVWHASRAIEAGSWFAEQVACGMGRPEAILLEDDSLAIFLGGPGGMYQARQSGKLDDTWTLEIVSSQGHPCCLGGFDQDGVLHVAFSGMDRVMRAWTTGEAWQFESVAMSGLVLWVAPWSVAGSASGTPLIAFSGIEGELGAGGESTAYLARRDEKGWHSEVLAGGSASPVGTPAVVVGTDGAAHVAYWVPNGDTFGLWYATGDSNAPLSEWLVEPLDPACAGRPVGISLDGKGSVHMGVLQVDGGPRRLVHVWKE